MPVVEEPVVNEPVVEEPVVNEPVVEEPVINEPVVEEPVVNEPVVEEPVVNEPIVEEPVVEEPIVEEPVVEEPVVEEPVVVEPVVEEPVVLEPVEEVVEEICSSSSDGPTYDDEGDSCDVYSDYPEYCGTADNEEFDSAFCCGCMFPADESEPEAVEEERVLATCSNDSFPGDVSGDGCDTYLLYPHWCGNYDTDEFISSTCCACQVGEVVEVVEEEGPDYSNCNNTDDPVDDEGDGCDVYFDYPELCYTADNDEFDSADCCGCQSF